MSPLPPHNIAHQRPAGATPRLPGLPKCRHRWSNHLLVGCRSPEDFGACPQKCSLQGRKIWGYLGANDLVTITNMFVIYKIVYDCNMILSHPPTMFSAPHATSFYLWKIWYLGCRQSPAYHSMSNGVSYAQATFRLRLRWFWFSTCQHKRVYPKLSNPKIPWLKLVI